MVEVVEGRGLGTLQRKWNILIFFVVVSVVSFLPMLFAGTTYWDIQTGIYFRAEASGGDIDFDAAIRTTQIRVVSTLVEFTAVTMGGDYISLIGLSASSNCDMTLLDIESDELTYEVTANAGQTSTTRVKIPSDKKVTQVNGASSWSFASPTKTVTVNVVHASTQQIKVHMGPAIVPITAPIQETISIIFQLQTFIVILLVLASLRSEEANTKILQIIFGNVVIMVILNFILNSLV